jgi:hypothetical protein
LDQGGEQGGCEWILAMPINEVCSKPEGNPEEHDQVRDQKEKGGFPIQKEHTRDQERPKDCSRCDGHCKGHQSRTDLPDYHFIE